MFLALFKRYHGRGEPSQKVDRTLEQPISMPGAQFPVQCTRRDWVSPDGCFNWRPTLKSHRRFETKEGVRRNQRQFLAGSFHGTMQASPARVMNHLI